MRYLLIIIFLISLLIFVAEKKTREKSESNENQKIEQKELSLNDRIYFYQHKLLPKWTFESNGAFYKDIKKRNLVKLKSAAEEIISSEYANNITAKTIAEHNGVLITFPKPSFYGECFFVFIREVDNRFLYVTYEKTRDIANKGFIGVVSNWTPDGNHRNHGPRNYSNPDNFLFDAIQIK